MSQFRLFLRGLLAQAAKKGTIQTKLASITAFGVGLAVLAIVATTYLTVRNSMYGQLDQELTEVASYAAVPISSDVEGLGGLSASALQASNVTLMLVRTDGTLRRVQGLRNTVNPGAAEIAVARTQEGASIRSVRSIDGAWYRLVAIPLRTESGRYALVIGRPLAATISTLREIGTLTSLLGLLFIMFSGVMGYATGRGLLRPLRELSQAVTHVTETDELEPIGTYRDDELGDLSRNFDKMMASLASSRERQQRLIADAGHELRTPLTSMRTNVELLVADQETGMLPVKARAEILHDVAAQLGEFTSLVQDLVQLSRDDKLQANRELIDFADVVDAAVARARRRGSSLHFDVALEPYFIIGDAANLERAVTNLLDNAVKFSPDGGTVHVSLRGGELQVWDEGPGIAEEDLPKIFDRFYRSNKARNTPGTGLGLSIVAHTVSSHGGEVTAGNAEGAGALFTLRLPAADPALVAGLAEDV